MPAGVIRSREAAGLSPRISITAMCDTSNRPQLVRHQLCSAITPSYWMGISQPANGTSLAPSSMWRECRGVALRSAAGSPGVSGDGSLDMTPQFDVALTTVYRVGSPTGSPPWVPPLSLVPERFERRRRAGVDLSPSVAGSNPTLSRVMCLLAVREPESFRGGCSFGGPGRWPTVALPVCRIGDSPPPTLSTFPAVFKRYCWNQSPGGGISCPPSAPTLPGRG